MILDVGTIILERSVLMALIFISYSRSDRVILDELYPHLAEVYGSESLWFDDAIPGGREWWEMILGEIQNCELFIYLISDSEVTP
jgi:hypothetical protein